jgi:hypothetical protein
MTPPDEFWETAPERERIGLCRAVNYRDGFGDPGRVADPPEKERRAPECSQPGRSSAAVVWERRRDGRPRCPAEGASGASCY